MKQCSPKRTLIQDTSNNDKSIKDLLRLQEEPFIYLSDMQIHDILMEHAVESMMMFKEFYLLWGEDEQAVTVPKKQVFKTPELQGDFRVMPCMTTIKNGIKVVKVIGTNEENRTIKDKISVGKNLLLDWHDNYVSSILDTCVLSSYRTAVISVLAYSLTNHQKFKGVAILGTGRIGFYTALLLHRWLGIKQINYFDPNPQSLENFEALVSHYLPELEVQKLKEDEILKHSEILFLATDSRLPILNIKNSQNLKFISSVGADADNLSELHESLISEYKVITDSTQSMLLGDMKIWRDKDLLCEDDVTELKKIIEQQGVINDYSLFISTGVAIQDAIITQFVVDKYKVKNHEKF